MKVKFTKHLLIAGFFLLLFGLSSIHPQVWASDPAMTSPSPGTLLQQTTVTFDWTNGSQAESYKLEVGTTGTGSDDIKDQNVLQSELTVAGIPQDGNPLNVRLWWRIGENWLSTDYIYNTKMDPRWGGKALVPRTGQTTSYEPGDDGE